MTTLRSTFSLQLLLDGGLVPGAGTLSVINPATGELLTACARADLDQLESAVQAAGRAFPTWAETPLRVRSAMLLALADALSDRKQLFATVLTEESGKPLSDAEAEVTECVGLLRGFAAMELSPLVLRDT